MIFHLSFWRSLKTRLTLLTLTVILISVWSLVLYANQILRDDLVTLLGEQQFSTVSIVAADINQEIEFRFRSLEDVAKSITPAQVNNTPELQTRLENRPVLSNLFNGGCFVTTIDGTATASIPISANRRGLNYMERDHVVAALKEGKSTVSKPVIGKALKTPVFSMGTPIRDAQGSIIGALVGVVDLSKPNFLDEVTGTSYGKTGGYLLIAPQHKLFVTATDKKLIMKSPPPPGVNPLFDRYVQGYEGSGVVTDSRGVEVLSAAKQIPAAGWFLVVRIPTTEAFAPIHQMQQRMLVAALILTIVAGGIIWRIVRRQLSPMLDAVSVLGTLSESNLPATQLPIARKDEVGQLIGSFNHLLATLALRESNITSLTQRYQLATSSAQLGIWDWNVRDNQMDWNDRMFELYGVTREASPNNIDIWLNGLHPEDKERALAECQKALNGEQEFNTEFRVLHPNGAVRHIKANSIVIRGADGAAERMIGINSDITAEKKLEGERNAAFQGFISVMGSIDALVYVADMHTYELLYVNEYGKKLFGNIEGKICWQSLQDNQSGPCAFCTNDHLLLENGEPAEVYTWEFQNTVTGCWFQCRDKAIRWHDDRLVRMEIATDISGQKQAQKNLQANITKLEVLLNVSSLPHPDLKTVSDHVLKSITLITDSEYGFYGFVNEDESVMTIHAWSGEAMQDCSMVDKPTDFAICTSGVWAEAVRRREPLILNNYTDDHSAKKGLPPGHIQLTRLLVVPVFTNSMITAVAAVANRSSDYTLDDVTQITTFLLSIQAITDSKRMEHTLKLSEDRYRLLTESVAVIPWEFDIPQNRWTYVGPQVAETMGYAPDEWTTLEWWLERIHPEDRAWVNEYCSNLTARGEEHSMEYRMMTKDGNVLWINDIVTIEMQDGKPVVMRGVMIDITDRKELDEEKSKLESQLHQAQKMESIGRLAGGVAHDFNNMLTVIQGYSELGLMTAEPASQFHQYFEEICRTAVRSADLTKQLLAFARKQTIEPKVLELNVTVSGTLKMLQRLTGEDIQLAWLPASDLWQTKADPSQIDQILANLCVNARDAIENTGQIIIKTRNNTIDANFCMEHPDAVTGEYVTLSVSDDGSGMDKETMSRIFEPFYTTKGVGEGTGLGLATVYGIVKQNNGFILIESEPGKGTTFSIHLPRYMGKAGHVSKEEISMPVSIGRETVLLVEDESAILKMAAQVLELHGYAVLKASTPMEAIRFAEEYDGEIKLLITDVIMPVMNGKDLATKLLSLNPQLRCLFMSGYTADTISQHGVLDEGVHFIQKPFSLPNLVIKVREVLDGKSGTVMKVL